VEHAALMPRKS